MKKETREAYETYCNARKYAAKCLIPEVKSGGKIPEQSIKIAIECRPNAFKNLDEALKNYLTLRWKEEGISHDMIENALREINLS